MLLLLAMTIPAHAEKVPADSVPEAEQAEKSTGQQLETGNKRYEPAERFTPTEKLRADDAVAFPVDI